MRIKAANRLRSLEASTEVFKVTQDLPGTHDLSYFRKADLIQPSAPFRGQDPETDKHCTLVRLTRLRDQTGITIPLETWKDAIDCCVSKV